jgi:hypothetical protein
LDVDDLGNKMLMHDVNKHPSDMSSIQPNSATVTNPSKAFVPQESFDLWELNGVLYNKDRQPVFSTETSQPESETFSTLSEEDSTQQPWVQENVVVLTIFGLAAAGLVAVAMTRPAPSLTK